MEGLVVRKIERLQEVGFIVPVTHSEWIAPIVPIVKGMATFGYVGIIKLPWIKYQSWIPKTEDLPAKIGGDQKFTKLDLRHAYQQLLLDDESRKSTTINTCKGLLRYTGLPYEISSSPGIFQRVIEKFVGWNRICNCETQWYPGHWQEWCRTSKEHGRNFETIFQELRKTNVFMAAKVVYCGHKVITEGVTSVEPNVQAIK